MRPMRSTPSSPPSWTPSPRCPCGEKLNPSKRHRSGEHGQPERSRDLFDEWERRVHEEIGRRHGDETGEKRRDLEPDPPPQPAARELVGDRVVALVADANDDVTVGEPLR